MMAPTSGGPHPVCSRRGGGLTAGFAGPPAQPVRHPGSPGQLLGDEGHRIVEKREGARTFRERAGIAR
jgi:hypothetical protein